VGHGGGERERERERVDQRGAGAGSFPSQESNQTRQREGVPTVLGNVERERGTEQIPPLGWFVGRRRKKNKKERGREG
jgi:hypothetical protein